MANDYYTNASDVVAGNKAKAEDINSRMGLIEDGFDKLPSCISDAPASKGFDEIFTILDSTDEYNPPTSKQVRDGSLTYAEDTGTANSIIADLLQAPSAYTTGMTVTIALNATNTGTTTINLNGLGAKAVKRLSGDDLSEGDIVAGNISEMRYNGTYFQLVDGMYAIHSHNDLYYTKSEVDNTFDTQHYTVSEIDDLLDIKANAALTRVDYTSNGSLSSGSFSASVINSNTGATSDIELQLPSGSDGLAFSFLVTESFEMKFTAATGEKFRWGQEECSDGGYISTSDIGSCGTVVWSGSEWVITDLAGTVNYLISGTSNEGIWSPTPASMDELGLAVEWVSVDSFKVTAGSIPDSTNNHAMKLFSDITKTLSSFAVGDGNGSLADTLTVSKFLNIYLIKDTSTGSVEVLAEQTNGTPSLPASYDVYRWLGAVYVDSSGELIEWDFTSGIPHKITFDTNAIQIGSLTIGNSAGSTDVDMSSYFPVAFTQIVNVGLDSFGFSCSTPGSGCGSTCYTYTFPSTSIVVSGADAGMPSGGAWEGTDVRLALSASSLCTLSATSKYSYEMITFNR